MESKLGEGEGAGQQRCSKLGAELRQGWLLGADGGRARAGTVQLQGEEEQPHGEE